MPATYLTPLRILKLSTLSLAIGFATFSQANEYRLADVAKPHFQSIDLNVDPNQDNFSGKTTIDLEVTKSTKTIELNGRDYAISMAKLVGGQHCDLANQMLETGKVVLTCEQEIKPGRYQLVIDFDAPFNRQSVGLYKTLDQGKAYLFTQFEMNDARRAFPVFDEPSFKIPFQMSITAPKEQKVYANTPLITQTEQGENIRYQFDKTLPISSYLLALAVGPFEEIPVNGMKVPGKVIAPAGKSAIAQSAADNIPPVLKALEDYFDIAYPYQKLDSVAVPEFPFGAMENAGLITYREDILLLDKATSTRDILDRHVSIIAHEQAHQWFGNLVTMKWWNDLWLNEAFASWMASKVTMQLHPEFERHLRLPQNYAMAQDARLSTKPIRKPINTEADIMDGLGLAYNKGEAVLSMIENWIGEDAFQQGMRSYMKKYAFKNAEAADLWNELGKAANKDVAGVLSTFIEQSSFPLIDVTQKGKTLTLNQNRFVNEGVAAPAQLWSVPVVIKYGKGDQVTTASVYLTDASTTVELEFEPEWLYPDANAMGYYRWKLDKNAMTSLLANAPTALNDRERLALISAADALLDAGVIGADELLKTLQAFVGDNHPKVASTAIGYLNYQRSIFAESDNKALWRKYLTKVVTPAIKKYGLEPKQGEDEAVAKLRERLVSLLGFEVQDAAIISRAKANALNYLKDPKSVDPHLAQTYLNLAAFHGSKEFISQLQKTFETTMMPNVRTAALIALGYTGDLALQKTMLDYSLSDKMTASDLQTFLAGNLYEESREAQTHAWVYANYAALENKFPPFALPRLPSYVASTCEPEKWQVANAFFGEKLEKVPGFKRTLEKSKEQVTTCFNLKSKQLATVNQYFKAL